MEVFDIINKLMKSDEDSATGDVQLLCKLFSGKCSLYHYSTKDIRHIPANTASSILGSTQLLNAAKLIAKMDHGHGQIDRILFATPLTFRPTLLETETVKTNLSTKVMSDFNELHVFQVINNIDHNTECTFEDDVIALLEETINHFVVEVNKAVQEGKVPPKSKTPELIPCLAAALHVLNHVMAKMLAGVTSTAPPTQISKSTMENASAFVQHVESQKGILCQVRLQKFIKIIHILSDFSLNAFFIKCNVFQCETLQFIPQIYGKLGSFYFTARWFNLNLQFLNPIKNNSIIPPH